MWQSQDLSVAIESETEEGSNEVTITVKNTAGTVLLFHENDNVTGKIEYLSNDGWVEYCDIYYTTDNASAISQQYYGTFAELEPGENWKVTIPEEKVAGMKNGTYRIKMAYVSEKKYKNYLEAINEDNVFENDFSEDIENSEYSDYSNEFESDNSDNFDNIVSNEDESIFESDMIPEDEVSIEEYHAASISELYIKTFEYEAPNDFVSDISFSDHDIDSNGPITTRIRSFDELY